jgi:hypothetical protein
MTPLRIITPEKPQQGPSRSKSWRPGRVAVRPAVRFGRFLEFDTNGGCWLWSGYQTKQGYGRFKLNPETCEFSHRAAWRIYRGPIPHGLHVLHRCDVPLCCNPDHLFLGTHADNMADMHAKGRARNGREKLLPHQVLKIREQLGAGAKRRDLCREYGVSYTTITQIHAGNIWRGVQ